MALDYPTFTGTPQTLCKNFLTLFLEFPPNENLSCSSFHISNTDHIMDVVQGGSPAPKINIICPHYPWKEDGQEQHVIYSVEKEEFETCRILRPQPRIIAKCTEPNKKK